MTDKIIEGFRLSLQQKRLWNLMEGQPASPHRLQASVLISGPLQPATLRQAVTDIVDRYEILRTVFQTPAGMSLPVQVIRPELPVAFQEQDVSGLTAAQQATEIDNLAAAMARQPLELAAGPLFLAGLIKLSANQHRLLLQLPALWADPATIKTLLAELGTGYTICQQDRQIETDEEEILQYADLAEWQFEMLADDEAQAGRAFWQHLDFLPFLQPHLPVDKQPAPTRFRPTSLDIPLTPSLATNLQTFSTANQVPVSLVLLTCWQVLLGRLRGEAGVVGVLCDGRTYEELEDAVGPLSKYLPLRYDLPATQSFAGILEQSYAALTEAVEWQEYFTWEAFEDATPGYFPCSFDFVEQGEAVSAGPLSFSLDGLTGCLDRFDLKLAGFQKKDTLQIQLHYDAALFEEAAIERLAGQFKQLLGSALVEVDRPVGELNLLPPEQRDQLLVEFNATDAPVSDDCIHHLIERQAEQTPDHAAVIFADQPMRYAELNRRANQVARHLQALGVGPDTLVGVHLERSPEMVVGLLGVLKAGAAYVPLDPDYPTERLALILEDTQAQALLTQAALSGATTAYAGPTITLDTDWPQISRHDPSNPSSPVTSENLAYVIFTSGSTGRPKGVPISHRNLVHSTSARMRYYQEPVDRFLLLSSYSFDSSVVGLFWPLCTGGTLVLPEEGLQRDPNAVAGLISRSQISHMLSLPSLYAYILAEAPRHDLRSLQTVIVAGEACPPALVERHRTLLPHTALFNEYGPTEGTVWCSVYKCGAEPLGATVPIGRPIANTRLYILDDRLQPVPIGVAGELHLGGVGLARGYLNRPALTAEKFIANPFGPDRLYKTGDLARYRANGTIEFLGRIDDQVKIRGYRVELGEIEATLKQHPAVRDAVVVAVEREPTESHDDAFAIDPKDLEGLVDGLLALDETEAEQLLAEISS